MKTQPSILVLGGYGTFGGRIIKALCKKGHHVIINGRNIDNAKTLQNSIQDADNKAQISVSSFDAKTQLAEHLQLLKPRVVIHTCGPFQNQNTQIAITIIKAGINYIDLSDDREYVENMLALNDLAKSHGVTAITAASTVPALSSAVLAHLQQKFNITRFNSVKIGISPGQKTDRGLATTEAVLSYLGKRSKPYSGSPKNRFGLQGTYLQQYPNIRSRLMGHCEAPDLDCLPRHFNINQLNFSAGMESKLLHSLLWLTSWLVRLGLPMNLKKHAQKLLKLSRWFDPLGTEDGGMHVEIEAEVSTAAVRNNKSDDSKQLISKTWYIEATHNEGPQIPAIPAILMAEKILNGMLSTTGVQACVDLISLDEYLAALNQYDSQSYRCYLE